MKNGNTLIYTFWFAFYHNITKSGKQGFETNPLGQIV